MGYFMAENLLEGGGGGGIVAPFLIRVDVNWKACDGLNWFRIH